MSPEEQRKRKAWNDQILRKEAPSKGCFTATYPSTEWQAVPCVKAPNIPAPPRRGPPPPAVVGDGNDISAQAPSGHITQAIGRFENVTNVTSESGPIGNAGPSIADAYTLQINTDFFTGSAACAGSPNAGCAAWEQWVYWNLGSGNGSASMQYWLVNYNTTCPAGQGWNQISLYGGISCWKNSNNAASVPNQPITNMANWTFSGIATAASDSVSMSTGTNVYTAIGDNVAATSTAWNIAEFNIFGAGGNSLGGGTATFNAGASADVRTQIFYGGTAAPICVVRGFTAEKNNLNFGTTPPAPTQPGPAVIFTESDTGAALANCANATTVGDTHLYTFSGLAYDFQATGDFVLAEVDPDFAVQARQVSGAPTWPDASVNSAVATRMGSNRIAICLIDGGEQLNINGEFTQPPVNGPLSLPGDVYIWRIGPTYFVSDGAGNSLRAQIHPTWIDVSVGLGKWPTTVRGLLANANGNVNQIATRDGKALTAAFDFNELYHRYADSWRVAAKDSLLSVCGGARETGIPSRPFYARDLDPQKAAQARAICTAAGVKAGPLLDDCTLDVAVIGSEEAAKVFVGARDPVVVGTIVEGGAFGPFGDLTKWCCELLILLLLIGSILLALFGPSAKGLLNILKWLIVLAGWLLAVICLAARFGLLGPWGG